MPKRNRQPSMLHSLIDECIVNPQTREEEALASEYIARECEKIHEERRALAVSGRRPRRDVAYEPSMMRMDYMPPVYSVSFSGQSPAYLGSQ